MGSLLARWSVLGSEAGRNGKKNLHAASLDLRGWLAPGAGDLLAVWVKRAAGFSGCGT